MRWEYGKLKKNEFDKDQIFRKYFYSECLNANIVQRLNLWPWKIRCNKKVIFFPLHQKIKEMLDYGHRTFLFQVFEVALTVKTIKSDEKPKVNFAYS